MQPLSRVSKQGHTVCGHFLIFVETFLVEYCQPGRGLSYSLTAPVLTFGTRVEMWGAPQDLCVWSFYQRHSWDWTPQGWEGHVQYVEGFLGQWGS